MAKSNVPINFSQGLNTKVDPWQTPIGQFELLQNSIFSKGGMLQKRNGYGLITINTPPSTYLTTLNGNLTSIGSTVNAYSSSLNSWITKGTLQPCSLSVLPLIRNNLNQTQTDSAVASGMVCTTFTETNTTTAAVVTQYLFAVADVVTGQNIVEPTAIPVITNGVITGSSRVFVVGNYFVIVSQVQVSGSSSYLQYASIPIANPVNTTTNAANVSAAQNVTAEVYVPESSNPGWDGIVANNTLVVAYNSTTTAVGVHVASLTNAQIASNLASTVIHQFNNAAYIGAIVSVCVDTTNSTNPVFYISFWNNSTTNGYTAAVTIAFGTITQQFAPQQIITSVAVANLASAAQNGISTIFWETTNSTGNFISNITVTSAGVVGTASVSVRSVGLASKAFIVNGVIYYLSAFSTLFQPTYFLINGSTSTSANPIVVAKLAYQNGGGYLALGLPNVSITDGIAQISYLYKDDVEALNTLSNPQLTTAGGIYSQTGINLVSFDVETTAISTAEIANNLHISGGFLSMYDGYLPVEHNFFVFPETISAIYTEDSTVTPTGTTTNGSFVITAVSSVSGVAPGMTISGAGIPANAIVVLVGTSAITMNVAATANHSSETITILGNIQAAPTDETAGLGAYYYIATYEWTDNQGLAYRSAPSIPITYTSAGSAAKGSVAITVPTLRLTAKIANKVKIVIYRWSSFTEVYNQVTTIAAPVLNDTTIDTVTFVDVYPDTSIEGNNILYTTGGVVPDYNSPATSVMTLFDTRLWSIIAEDPNTLGVSKQVIEATPVEMSAMFTIYVAPNIGTTGSTGPMRALAPMDDKLIIFKKNAIYYINGVGPNNLGTTSVGCSLGNYSQPIFITSVVGCDNQNSIVLTDKGLMFQSDKGIWLLDRQLQTSYIGAPVEDFNSSVVTSSNVIPETNYVVFTLDSGQSLMYDYYYGQWGTFVGFSSVSSCIYNGLHTILDKYGRILQETPGQYLDGSNPVLMAFNTAWINLAGVQGFERFYWFYLLGRYLSPHFIECGIAYNYNDSLVQSSQIDPINFASSVSSPYGDQSAPYGSPIDLEQWLVHAQYQKCQSFQIQIREVFNPAFGTVAGPGFTLSGLNLVALMKRGSRPISQATTTG